MSHSNESVITPSGDIPAVVIYGDGSCIPNPGSGGYGVVLLYGQHRKEASGGFRDTTNNRMEIMSAIVGLQVLKKKCRVTFYTDSQYVVHGIAYGWAKRWQANGWRRNRKERAVNADLWGQLLDLRDQHEVDFRWVRGHVGNPENENCDRLAREAACRQDLPLDEGSVAGSAAIRPNQVQGNRLRSIPGLL